MGTVLAGGVHLTLSHPEDLPWRVKSSGVRQSKITKGTVLAGLGEKRLKTYHTYFFLTFFTSCKALKTINRKYNQI